MLRMDEDKIINKQLIPRDNEGKRGTK